MKKLTIVIVAIVFIAVAVFVLSDLFANDDQDQDLQTSQSVESLNATGTNNTQVSDETFTEDEVSQHNTADDCWTIMDGVVYDISSYVSRHPGGEEILLACGGDGTTLFNNRTTQDGERIGSGTAHSSFASSQLADFKIGIIE